jgi:hypothetical protein
LPGCKHSSLFGLVVSNKEKKFYNIDPRKDFIEAEMRSKSLKKVSSFRRNKLERLPPEIFFSAMCNICRYVKCRAYLPIFD